MNATDELIMQIKDMNKSNNMPLMVLQCITICLILLKPVLMYWIQAKYKADPPHEEILRSVEGEGEGDNVEESSHDEREVKTFQLTV